MEAHAFFARLDAANSEDEVRTRLAAGNYNTQHAALAQEWLRRKEAARSAEAAAKHDVRSEEMLSIAKTQASAASAAALAAQAQASAAFEQARWAKWAAIIATVAAIIATVAAIK
jgi:hypothetical protein